jgi:hypothetical protein
MAFWQWLWTLVWFGGLALFAVLAVIITVQGARDLKALLRGLREERTDEPGSDQGLSGPFQSS